MQPQIHDLFGQIIVTTHDIDAWLLAIPRIDPYSRRASYYVKSYDVINKIKAAKLAEIFDALTTAIENPPSAWRDRFSWVR